jgi:pyridoxal phosphate enzyme (YggS family)
MIAENLESVRRRIAKSCEKIGKDASGVTLVCVTKETDAAGIEEVLRLGVKDIGENRVQDAAEKHKAIGSRIRWHLVGHLQTNKAKDAVRIFDLIHSVDSARLAKEIDKEAKKIDKVQDILIQVNTSGEESKFGVTPEDTQGLIKELILYQNITIKGLMTIAPEASDPETVRPYFRKLRELRDKLYELRVTGYELRLLSMGMSGDFEIAIGEGSNMVRIGRAIFK